MKLSTLVITGVSILVSQSLSTAQPLASPTGVYVIACGPKKLAIYWDTVKGARSYYVYRSTKSGRQNYKFPIAKLSRIPDSAAGSGMKLWVNRDLSNGKEYFYTVKAVDAKGRLSRASKEDSDIVDPLGMPWDSRNPKTIVSAAIKEANGSSPDEIMVGPRDSFEVMGPDGMVYQRGTDGSYSVRKSNPIP